MFFSKGIVGLDIGSSSIKLVHLKKSKRGIDLLNFGIIPIPPETIVEGAVEKPELVTTALRNIFTSEKLKNRKTSSSLSGQSLVIKKINLPKMTNEELEEAIRSEAEQYIPFDIDEVNIDFQVIKESKWERNEEDSEDEEDSGTMDVLLIAVRKEMIEEKNQPLLDADLIPSVLDLDVFAMENVFELNYGVPVDEVLALINMGASFTNVNILINGITEVTRDLPGAGNQINHDLQKAFDVDYEKAENLKLGIELENISEKDVAESIYSSLKDISHEINKMFHDFIKMTQKNIDRVVLSGGCAKFKGIDRILADNFDLNVEIMDPFKNIRFDEKKFDPDYIRETAPVAAIAVGLAIRAVEDKVK